MDVDVDVDVDVDEVRTISVGSYKYLIRESSSHHRPSYLEHKVCTLRVLIAASR